MSEPKAAVRPPCLNCRKRLATRLRDRSGHFSLCEKCWAVPSIRENYLPSAPYAGRGRRRAPQ